MKQRYDSYKPSGIDWIGEIPSHWNMCTLRYNIDVLTDYTANGSFGDLAANVTYLDEPSFSRLIRLTDLRKNLNNEDGVWVNEEAHKYLSKSELFGGELLMANVGAYAGYVCSMPKVNIKSTLGPNMFLIKLKEGLSHDYYRYLLSQGFESLQVIALSSAQPKLNKENVRTFPIILPPLSEQQVIAAWLDTQCGEIDSAIAKVDREIELIDELKQSEISRVVTRGLNPDATLRPSGIDWIGDVPEHWTVAKMARILNGIQDGTHGTFNRVENGKPLLSAKNVFEEGISITDNESQISQSDFEEIVANGYPQKGDIALCCVATIGRGCIYNYDYPMAFQRSVTFLRIGKNCSNKYILYYLRSICAKIQFETYAKTSAQSGVYMGDLKKFYVLLPPLSEQQAIADYLDKRCAEMDGLKAKLIKKRETLKELRQAIISEVVTGKRKVI